jgi:hypothetical protein
MRKAILVIECTFLAISLTHGICLAKYSGGTGEPNDPYLIASPNDLNSIGLDPNDWDKHFKLTADIDMSEYSYTTALIAPDTNSAYGYQGIPFTGSFDGNGFVIEHLVIDALGANNSYLGLFGSIGSGAQIKNVSLESGYVSGDGYVGGLAGMNDGTIHYCYMTGSVNGNYGVGGLVGGSFAGDISHSYATGPVSGYHNNIGGLLGYSRNTTISHCNARGQVTGTLTFKIGGLIGFCKSGEIISCYATGSVICNFDYVGGLVGEMHWFVGEGGTIGNSYATGNTSGRDMVGGLTGSNAGYVNNSFATGSITGASDVGGLVGVAYSRDYNNCYATGSVIGVDSVGGLIGKGNFGILNSCYATGSVTGDVLVGGLIGFKGQYVTINDSYFLSPVDGGGPDNGFGTPLTDVQMKQQSTFTNWDFVTPTWKICEGTNYPKLAWQIPLPGDFVCPDGVNFIDFSILASSWLSAAGEIDWNAVCDISDPNDDIIDELDLAVFCENWLAGSSGCSIFASDSLQNFSSSE